MKWQIGHFLLLRYGLRIPLDDSEESIEKAILSSFVLFKIKFREMWGKHFCDVEGCGQFLMSDGGMKIQRCDFWLVQFLDLSWYLFFLEPFPLKDSISQKSLYRQICAAKYSVVRSYRHSDHLVLTGCTRMPGKGSKFCWEHQVVVKKPLSDI